MLCRTEVGRGVRPAEDIPANSEEKQKMLQRGVTKMGVPPGELKDCNCDSCVKDNNTGKISEAIPPLWSVARVLQSST